jgi:hypothetical protein
VHLCKVARTNIEAVLFSYKSDSNGSGTFGLPSLTGTARVEPVTLNGHQLPGAFAGTLSKLRGLLYHASRLYLNFNSEFLPSMEGVGMEEEVS